LLGVGDESFVVDDSIAAETAALMPPYAAQWSERVALAGARGEALLAQLANNGALVGEASAAVYDGGNVATRKAMQRAMDTFAAQTTGITSGSADLTDNTGVVVSFSSAQTAENPGGRQIYYGIREFAMGAIMVGQALHGGIRPIGSTFFVFSDYVRPALRMAALSEASTLFVFTHDSVGVGEDGPTHQPIEQLMSLRVMPELHVVRPTDANETVQLVEHYLRSATPPPTALILTRQDIPVLTGSEALASREGAARGGYVVRENPDAVFTLMATGSEVAHCLEAADMLAEQEVAVRVVALPCWACFQEQTSNYRGSVLRYDLPSVSLEAGATLGWHKYADESLGIDSFGLSAPGAFVFEHFSIAASAVVDHVLNRLAGE